ncbi:MAG TPA: tetratricopeptide repeat protein [Bryobacteraceae bacterium]|jgi:tetratricopeptide (TPR) repeat protein|nr:tetratricopeptide repeat protein [Bryobacteraceae bacterium]
MRSSRISMILVSATLAAILLPAQKGGTTTGTSTGSTTGTGTTGTTGTSSTGNIPSSTTGSNPGSTTTLPRPGEFFFGTVVMPDGTPPPAGVIIERVCNGAARPQAYTDSRGDFSFQVGQTQDMMPDASVDTGVGRRGDLSGTSGSQSQAQGRTTSAPFACDLRANMPGYRSDLINLAGRRNLDDPNVGTIKLHSLASYDGLTTSATSSLAPKEARKAFESGVQAEKKSKIDEAQADFIKATDLYPRYASAWFELGLVYEKRQKIPEAREAYAKSIAADSKFVNPYAQLFMLAFAEKKWEDVARISNQVMHLNPYDFPESLYYNAVANSQLMRLDAAEKSAREAVQLSSTQNPKVYYILGVILAKKQDFKGAAENLRTYLKSDAVTDRDKVAKLLADVEKQGQARAELKTQP